MSPVGDTLANYIAGLPAKIDLSLERMEALLEALGHPEKRLPPTIHVAGTNGKGSTIAFLRAMLEAAGHRVHVFTSPHLVRYEERVRLGALGGGQLVSEAAFLSACMRCVDANGHNPITVFEIITAAALLLFSEHEADVLLLEVGLGGRLDSTNVVGPCAASVITPIGYDHMEFLGDTLEAIAGEKAGIIKPGTGVCVVAPQPHEVVRVFARAAARARVPLRMGEESWRYIEENGRWIFEDDDGLVDLPLPRLVGRHQLMNAATAVATLRALPQFQVTEKAMLDGLKRAEWPARLQRLTQGHLADMLMPPDELWLDGAHNAAGASVLAEAMADLEDLDPKSLHLIVGMLKTKDPTAFLKPFEGLARAVWCVPILGESAARPAMDISTAAANLGFVNLACDNVAHALHAIRGLSDAPVRVLMCGSLYLAGQILSMNDTLPR
jgi:dihydrofolate synthase / folylpolyglutamate synthase